MSGKAQSRLELYTGKGGTGKTTLAATAAWCYAESGARVLLVSADNSGGLASVLGLRLAAAPGKPAAPVTVRPGLTALAVDSAALLEQRHRALAPLLNQHHHDSGITLPAPGELVGLPLAEELLAWDEIITHADSGEWDVVVVDCGPTADMLRALSAPHLLLSYLEQLWPAHQRAAASGLRATVLAAVFAEIAASASRMRDVLTSHTRTTARLLALPQRAGVQEAARLRSAAALFGVRMDTLIHNRLHAAPEPRSDWHTRRTAAQLEAVAQLEQALPGLTPCYLPDSWTEPVGLAGLAGLAADFADAVLPQLLFANPAPDNAGHGPDSVWRSWPEPASPAVHTIRMYLPVADPATLRLGRAEDDVIVGADGVRRRLALPAGLAGATVVDAELDGHYLIVRLRTAENFSG